MNDQRLMFIHLLVHIGLSAEKRKDKSLRIDVFV